MASNFIETSLYDGKVKVKFFPDSHQYWVNGKRKTGVTTIIGIVDKSAPLMTWAVDLAVNYLREKLISNQGENLTELDFYEASIQHTLKKEKAATIGDEVHGWIEKYINKENPEMPTQREAQIGVNAFLDWVNQNKVKFISSERIVYSKKHDFIGKMDIEAKVNGKLCLIDIKTSNSIYNTYSMQTAAYCKADEEESGKKYEGRYIIRLAKETEQEYLDRMKEKNQNRIRKGSKEFSYPEYQVFEVKYLDQDEDNIDRDYKAFLACKTLKKWDNETNTFYN